MADKRKFLYNQSGNRPIYRSRKLNKNNPNVMTNEGTRGLDFGESIEKAVGKEGINRINKDLGVHKTLVSTGGGDVMEEDDEFVMAYSDEEAEDIRESTDGEVIVRRPQKRKANGQFGGSVKEDEAQFIENMQNDKDYLKKMSGKSDEEWEKTIKSIDMDAEEFIEYAIRNYSLVSKDYVNKQKLLSHLNKSKKRKYGDKDRTSNLTGRQKRDFVRKYGNKVLQDKGEVANEIKATEKENDRLAKLRSASAGMKRYWRKRKQSSGMKKYWSDVNSGKRTRGNKSGEPIQSGDNFESIAQRTTAEANADLSNYTQNEIDRAIQEIRSNNKNPDYQPNNGEIRSVIEILKRAGEL